MVTSISLLALASASAASNPGMRLPPPTTQTIGVTVPLGAFMLFCDRFSSGFDQVAAFAVVEFVINVNNCAFFHGATSKG